MVFSVKIEFYGNSFTVNNVNASSEYEAEYLVHNSIIEKLVCTASLPEPEQKIKEAEQMFDTFFGNTKSNPFSKKSGGQI